MLVPVLVGGFLLVALVLTAGTAQATPIPRAPPPPPLRGPTPAPTPTPPPSTGDFVTELLRRGDDRRESLIEHALLALGGAVFPAWMLPENYVPVTVQGGGHTVTFYVAKDYASVLTPQGAFRVPMRPGLAQKVADHFSAVLPTPRMVDAIYAQAPVKIGFVALRPNPGEHQDSSRLYVENQRRVEERRAGREGLAAGHKKDIVVGNLLARTPHKVLIYGGWYPDGTKVQPYSNVHDDHYVDYSHGVRLVAPTVRVDGVVRSLHDVLRDPVLAPLLSHEGIVRTDRYAVPL